MITLYSARLSLFAKKVEIALAEKGLEYSRVLVPFDQNVGYSPKHPEVLAANPKGQVPVLIDGDLVLYDSTIIIEYLDEAYPYKPLLPRGTSQQGAQARAQCRLLDLFADEVMLVPLCAFMHRTGPRPADPQRWAELEQAAVTASTTLSGYFVQLDTQLEGHDYLCDAFSAADIAVFMAVLYAQRLGGPGLSAYPSLASWYRAMHQRPAFAKVAAEVAAADRDLSASVDGGLSRRCVMKVRTGMATGRRVVIELNLDVIKTADWVIDLGPEGGVGLSGDRRSMVTATFTGHYLALMR